MRRKGYTYATEGDMDATLHDIEDGDMDAEYLALFRSALAPDSLDAAWAEAEAALPEDMHLAHVSLAEASASDPDPDRPGYLRSRFFYCETWEAMAANVPSSTQWVDQWAEFAYGPTPAAALRALAAKLREAKG